MIYAFWNNKGGTGKHSIFGRETQISGEYLEKCKDAIETLVKKI